ncbi:hypothetical protein C8R48DRAFT_679231 [Suillus tomentosus]|nr:hypothetical protein C8R48DRAFT_679231 [Suillus tomentosus]
MILMQTTHSTLLANIDKIQRHAGPDAPDVQEDHYRRPLPSRTCKRLDAGIQTLGEGLELWRGYFQSVHPTIGKNIDVSTAVMFKQGSFQTAALAVLKQNNVHALDLCPDLPQFRQVKNFFKGVSVTLIHRLAGFRPPLLLFSSRTTFVHWTSAQICRSSGRFQTAALAVLKQNNVHALDLCPDLLQFRQVKNFFKGISVTLIHRLAGFRPPLLLFSSRTIFAAVQAGEELLQGRFCHAHPQAGRFQTAALAVLKQNDLHALDLCPDLPQFRQLKNFFKGVSVTLIHWPGLENI